MNDLLILVGPTGVGKTAVAIELCHLLDGEVVSADSMQIYRGFDIGTAKASAEEQRRARHHLIDIRDPHETYSAAQWASDARVAIADIQSRGKTPVIAGGTGFYLKALLEPETLAATAPNSALRAELEAEATAKGAEHLHAKLQAIDPAAAARLHANDTRRVIRAMEVALSSSQAETAPQPSLEYKPHVYGLTMERELVVQRIERRVEAMLQAGFMDELRGLLEAGVPLDCIPMQGVGYRQMLPALKHPELFDEGVELWKRDTRRYAKRQMTWFRNQLPTRWIELDDSRARADIAQHIAGIWRACLQK